MHNVLWNRCGHSTGLLVSDALFQEPACVRVQVICETFHWFPPSTWFKADNPVPFLLIACHVITVTAAAAWLLRRATKYLVAKIARE